MNPTAPFVNEAEGSVRDHAAELPAPSRRECLCCYLARALAEFSCDDTHRLTFHYRDTVAPRATTLRARLDRMGASRCDCEVLSDAYQLAVSCVPAHAGTGDAEPSRGPGTAPRCQGVRRGSVRPCPNWVRVLRWHLWG